MATYQHELTMTHAEEAKTTHTVLVAIALIASVMFIGAWIFSGEDHMTEYSSSQSNSLQTQTSSSTGALSSERVYTEYTNVD